MKYHALFVSFEKAAKFFNCCLLQIIGGALRVKEAPDETFQALSKTVEAQVLKLSSQWHHCLIMKVAGVSFDNNAYISLQYMLTDGMLHSFSNQGQILYGKIKSISRFLRKSIC